MQHHSRTHRRAGLYPAACPGPPTATGQGQGDGEMSPAWKKQRWRDKDGLPCLIIDARISHLCRHTHKALLSGQGEGSTPLVVIISWEAVRAQRPASLSAGEWFGRSVGPSCHLAQAFLHWAGCIDAAMDLRSAGDMVLVVVVNLMQRELQVKSAKWSMQYRSWILLLVLCSLLHPNPW